LFSPAAVRKLEAGSRIIPGNWGKVGSGWLARPLSSPGCKARRAEAGFTSPSDDGRASSVRESGAERPGAIRSRSEPSQVTQAGFGPERIAVTQRVRGCDCASSTEQAAPAVTIADKTTERWTKGEPGTGRTRCLGKTRENLPNAGDPFVKDRWPVSERQPER
jgi:hypothetical protein